MFWTEGMYFNKFQWFLLLIITCVSYLLSFCSLVFSSLWVSFLLACLVFDWVAETVNFYLVSCRIYLYSVNLLELYCRVRLTYLVNSTGSCFYDLLGCVLQCSCRADYFPLVRKDASVYSSHYPMNLEFSLFCPVGTITAPRLVWVPKTVPSNPPSWFFPWPGVVSTNICRVYSPEHLKEILCSSLCSLFVCFSLFWSCLMEYSRLGFPRPSTWCP